MTIHKSIWVARPPAASFKIFCDEMCDWWPGGFNGKDSKLCLEPSVGGRFYERKPDGTEYEIGRVTAYDPPALVAFSWRAPSWEVSTQVRIRFIDDNGGTRVELEHSGWNQDEKTRESRRNYDAGWGTILGHYQAAFTTSNEQEEQMR